MDEVLKVLRFMFGLLLLAWATLRVLFRGLKFVWKLFSAQKGLTTHGDADWAAWKQLRSNGHLEPLGWFCATLMREGRFWRMMPTSWRRVRVFTHRDASLFLIAPKGRGKSQSIIAAIREQAGRTVQPDLVIGDPAGDIEAATRETLRQAGYSIIRIDLINPPSGQSCDVLNFLRPMSRFDFDRDVDQFCHLVLPDDAHTREAHFQEFSRILLAGALTYLLETSPNETTLYRVVEILTTDAKERRLMFEAMRKKGSSLVRQAVNAYEEAGDRERGSFSTTMTRKLKIWLRESVKHVTQTSRLLPNGDIDRGWTWEDVYEADFPVVVFIKTGLGTDEGAVARLIMGNAVNTRRRMWNHLGNQDRPFPKPLRIIADEARTIGNCNAFMDANNELRKAGVSTLLSYISLRDVRDIYPQADTLIAGSDIVVFGGSNEMAFYKEVSEILGDKTIESASKSESAHGQSKGANEQARRLMKPDELRRLRYEDCVVVLDNLALKANKPFTRKTSSVEYH